MADQAKLTVEQIIQWAKEDASTAIVLARHPATTTPIIWLTSNRFMPPLRAFGKAEEVWQAGDDVEGMNDYYDSAWMVYVEVFEEELSQADVYLGCPEYDNALYVVDMQRWRLKDMWEEKSGESLREAERKNAGLTLEDEWEKVDG